MNVTGTSAPATSNLHKDPFAVVSGATWSAKIAEPLMDANIGGVLPCLGYAGGVVEVSAVLHCL